MFLQDVKSCHYCRTSQMLHLCFSVVHFEQSVSLSDVFSEVSSAKMSQLTLLLVICRGRSLIKIENRSGPKIDP